MKIESDVFVNNGKIPIRYTCNGEGIQIPIKMFDVPKDAKSLALIVDDPDAPNGDFVHWVVWNIDPKFQSSKIIIIYLAPRRVTQVWANRVGLRLVLRRAFTIIILNFLLLIPFSQCQNLQVK